MNRIKQTLAAAFICTSALFLSSNSVRAQLADPGFENWDSVENSSFTNYLPAGWGDFINQTANMEGKPWAVTRSTDAHSGSYAIQLKNVALSAPMAATLMTRSGNPEEFNNKIPVNSRHTRLEGYYKYSSPANDTFHITVIMMKDQDFIGFADYTQSKKADDYTKFSIPIMYTSAAGIIPDSATILITAGSIESFVEGTTLLLDDVNFNLSSGLQRTNTELRAEMSIWPNPASDQAQLILKGELNGPVKVEIVNLLGQVVRETEYKTNNNQLEETLNLVGLPKGLLFIKVSDLNGAKAMRIVHE